MVDIMGNIDPVDGTRGPRPGLLHVRDRIPIHGPCHTVT